MFQLRGGGVQPMDKYLILNNLAATNVVLFYQVAVGYERRSPSALHLNLPYLSSHSLTLFALLKHLPASV
jgi:hypothetical protein